MAGIAVAESSKPKKGPKVIDHLEIHPELGGGKIVKHVYTNYEHEPAVYKFNKNGIAQGGEHILTHLAKHAGLPAMSAEGSETEKEAE